MQGRTGGREGGCGQNRGMWEDGTLGHTWMGIGESQGWDVVGGGMAGRCGAVVAEATRCHGAVGYKK